jgi:hypothetical protein
MSHKCLLVQIFLFNLELWILFDFLEPNLEYVLIFSQFVGINIVIFAANIYNVFKWILRDLKN